MRVALSPCCYCCSWSCCLCRRHAIVRRKKLQGNVRAPGSSRLPSELLSPLGSKWVRSNEDVTLLLLDLLETGLLDKALSRSEDKGSEDVAAVLKEHVKNAAVVLL